MRYLNSGWLALAGLSFGMTSSLVLAEVECGEYNWSDECNEPPITIATPGVDDASGGNSGGSGGGSLGGGSGGTGGGSSSQPTGSFASRVPGLPIVYDSDLGERAVFDTSTGYFNNTVPYYTDSFAVATHSFPSNEPFGGPVIGGEECWEWDATDGTGHHQWCAVISP